MDRARFFSSHMSWIESVFVWAALLSVAVLFFLHPVGTSDLFWQMKAGELLWDTGSIPRFDPFTFTAAGNTWVDHEWLAGLLFFGAWRIGGFEALSILSFLAGFGIVASVFCTARRLSGSPYVGVVFALLVCAAGAQRFQQLRPDLFAFLFFSILLLIAFSSGLGFGTRLSLLAALHVIWANVHASAIIGPPIVLLAGAAEIFSGPSRGDRRPGSWKKLACLSAACAAALLINPYFTHAYTFPFEHMGQGFSLSVTSDWARATWILPQADISSWGLAALSILSVAAIIICRGRRPFPWAPAVVAAACLPAGFWMMRFVPFSAIALSAFIAALLGAPRLEETMGSSVRRVAALVFAFGALLLMYETGPLHGARGRAGGVDLVLGLPVGVGLLKGEFPEEAADFIERSGIEGNLFNDMSWGGYLIWRNWPDRRVFIDTRTPIYGEGFMKSYSDALFIPEAFEEVADRWQITHVLYDARDVAVEGGPLRFLLGDPGWKTAFLGANAVVFIKR